MTSWHIEQQDGNPYYMPQCEVCGLRYDEYGLYADKEQAATDAVDDGWQAWPDLYHTDWDCRCPPALECSVRDMQTPCGAGRPDRIQKVAVRP